MTKNVVNLQQIRREYVNIDFDGLLEYAKSRAWAKHEENHVIVPIDQHIQVFLQQNDLYNPTCNYLMLIDKTENVD